MVKQTQLALSDAAEWLGDWHPLAEQLGSTEGLVSLASASSLLDLPPVRNYESLAKFLRDYQEQILFPLELPAIQTAHRHAGRSELRELIDLDRRLAAEDLLQNFAAASRRIGKAQLQKLRPLRDQRMVRRFLRAVDAGEANGWHTLVYGLTLELYSLPLRQGLLGYAEQTTRGFIYAAAPSLRLSEHECRALFDDLSGAFPRAVQNLFRNGEM